MKKLLILITTGLFYVTAFAQKSEIFQKDGKAIRGYDPVAFFTVGSPVMGDSLINFEWKEANWQFSSKENMELFKANPEKYAPQYGGYCAYGMADGHKAPTEIDAWTVVDGKLYFNYNMKVKDLWSQKLDELIKKADINWKNTNKK